MEEEQKVGREQSVLRLTESLQVRGTAFHKRFGWTPPATLDQGLAATVAWFTQARSRLGTGAPSR